jgi:hypothetical protein
VSEAFTRSDLNLSVPVAEKLRLLDAMYESALSIRSANRRQVNVVREQPPDYGTKS